ncbi:MAG: bifunctional diguanylate cyclase/phosphodiesterase [Campylobacterota bacterium]|nr:bifunctional diguanylate cyclase/phosphodiesterase [Campylobacterota bacterium]
MTYNILIIDNEETIDTRFLEPVENKEIIFATNEDNISYSFITNEIHMLLLNKDILSLDELYLILENHDINYTDIPIFIIGDYSEELFQNDKLNIYDFIDIKINPSISINKIKFCQNLYKKQLKHDSNIKKILYIDSLTKLPNRAKLIKDIQDEIGINSIAIIDINSFKDINEFFGLKVGDNILKRVVNIIEEMTQFIQDKVNLYKFSSDVYCLANKGLDENSFEDIITFILGAIESKIFIEDDHEINIRAKAGITFSNKKNKLITADIALKEAKKRNKEYLVFYDELDNLSEYQNNMTWTKKLKDAMEQDNIVVYYQPLINNQTMKVDKYECLVRMIDGDKIISPFFFLEISKKANQYRNLTKIVIEKSFQEFENLPFEFSVNVSYEDIEDKYFLHFIKEKLKKYNCAKKVVWEILEDESIKDYSVLINFIKEVKTLGCKVAIDDFGTGYSNFEHLLNMDVDYLKIDASLVKHVATNENSHKVVKTIIDFAKSLNLKTISEYVENEDIFKTTKALGSTYSQGFYFSAPIAKPTLESF